MLVIEGGDKNCLGRIRCVARQLIELTYLLGSGGYEGTIIMLFKCRDTQDILLAPVLFGCSDFFSIFRE